MCTGIVTIISGVSDLVSSITGDIDEKKGAFTQQTRDQLLDANPGWNVLVFHDTSSPRNMKEAYCHQVELPLDPTGITEISFGYRVCVFKEGW
jgi:hypothetical protein